MHCVAFTKVQHDGKLKAIAKEWRLDVLGLLPPLINDECICDLNAFSWSAAVGRPWKR